MVAKAVERLGAGAGSGIYREPAARGRLLAQAVGGFAAGAVGIWGLVEGQGVAPGLVRGSTKQSLSRGLA